MIDKVRFKIGDKIYPEIDIPKMLEKEKNLLKKREENYKKMLTDPKGTRICGTCKYYNPKALYDYGSSGYCSIYGWKEFDDSCKRWKWDGIESVE